MISVLLSFWQFKINVLSFHSGNNAKLECANLFSVHTQKEKFSFFWSLFLCSWRMDGGAHVPAEKQQQLVIYLNNTNLFFFRVTEFSQFFLLNNKKKTFFYRIFFFFPIFLEDYYKRRNNYYYYRDMLQLLTKVE